MKRLHTDRPDLAREWLEENGLTDEFEVIEVSTEELHRVILTEKFEDVDFDD